MPDPPSDNKAKFRCPRCLGKVSAGPEYFGLFVSCAHCQARIRVPIPADLEALGMTPSDVLARQAEQVERALRHAREAVPRGRSGADLTRPSVAPGHDAGVAPGPGPRDATLRKPGGDPFPLAPTPRTKDPTPSEKPVKPAEGHSGEAAAAQRAEAPKEAAPGVDLPHRSAPVVQPPTTTPILGPAAPPLDPRDVEVMPDPLAALAALSDTGAAGPPVPPPFGPEHATHETAELGESDDALRALAEAASRGVASPAPPPASR
ncbi:MAG: hypothetical protein AAGA57_07715 [Planctomycetota bacterium]